MFPPNYEAYFPKISLAKISHRKKMLEYSQPRNILAQNIPGDERNIFEEYFGSLYVIELSSAHDEAYLPSITV